MCVSLHPVAAAGPPARSSTTKSSRKRSASAQQPATPATDAPVHVLWRAGMTGSVRRCVVCWWCCRFVWPGGSLLVSFLRSHTPGHALRLNDLRLLFDSYFYSYYYYYYFYYIILLLVIHLCNFYLFLCFSIIIMEIHYLLKNIQFISYTGNSTSFSPFYLLLLLVTFTLIIYLSLFSQWHWVGLDSEVNKHAHVRFHAADGTLCYVDSRRFGSWHVSFGSFSVLSLI